MALWFYDSKIEIAVSEERQFHANNIVWISNSISGLVPYFLLSSEIMGEQSYNQVVHRDHFHENKYYFFFSSAIEALFLLKAIVMNYSLPFFLIWYV